ncbi:MAG: Rieske (2Fe-2S) protein [Jatrophihabitans sp.]|uniref:Rieske (2Fe-2S) protein n=1 Tax=Jatrophihabitans sp. TaxID=1932789 RepID=UPI0039125CD4
MSDEVTRRSALTATGTVVVGGVVGFVVARNSAVAKDAKGTTAANAYGNAPAAAGKALAPLEKIPANGGLVVGRVVLTRGAGIDVHAFSAVCPHQGCLVDRVANGTIDCPCHGSRFDATTGKRVAGPAQSPLAAVAVTVRDGQVFSA